MYYSEKTIVYKDGTFLPAKDTFTDVYGQTLHYGYGVFEGIRSYATEKGPRIFKAIEHYERLKKSAQFLSIPFAWDIQDLVDKTYELLDINGLQDAYIRPVIVTPPNMSLTRATDSSLYILVWEWGNYLGENLVKTTGASYCRPHPKSVHIEAKANGYYVNSILASTEAKANGYDEAILNDVEGYLAEASGANLFIQKDNKLYTPQKGHILPGITRQTILELCRELGVEVVQGQYTPSFLKQADAAFLCGTAAEVVGILSYEEVVFPLAWNTTLGKKLQQAYKQLVVQS